MILGSRETVREMIAHADEQKRYTGFVCRLRELIGKKENETYE